MHAITLKAIKRVADKQHKANETVLGVSAISNDHALRIWATQNEIVLLIGFAISKAHSEDDFELAGQIEMDVKRLRWSPERIGVFVIE